MLFKNTIKPRPSANAWNQSAWMVFPFVGNAEQVSAGILRTHTAHNASGRPSNTGAGRSIGMKK